MADKDSHSTDSSVSSYEGHLAPLRVAPVGARLSTPAKMKMVKTGVNINLSEI